MGKAFSATDVATPSLSLDISMNLLPPTDMGERISQ